MSKAEAIRGLWRELGAHARNRDVIAALVPTTRVESVSLGHLLAAKKVADQLGGIEVARQAMASFAKLMR